VLIVNYTFGTGTKKKKVRIVTSIITIQEVSVSTFQRGKPVKDNHAVVGKLARILSIDKETALTAAKYEAHALDDFKGNDAQKAADNKRRKMDCFHIACAVVNESGTLYSLDSGMLNRQQQFRLPGIAFLRPEPSEAMLDLQEALKLSPIPIVATDVKVPIPSDCPAQ
jgi:predicted nucleic acid-binding protein